MAAQRSQNVDGGMVHLFRLDLAGFNSAQAQQVTLGKMSIDVVKLSKGGHDVKRPGRMQFDAITIVDLIFPTKADTALYDWFFSMYDPDTGTQKLPLDLRDGSVTRLDGAGRDLESWAFVGAWPSEIEGYKYDKTKSECHMRSVKLEIESIRPLPLLVG